MTDHADLVRRLRRYAGDHLTDGVAVEAADAIEGQAARIAEALDWLRQGDGASAISALHGA